MSTVQSIVVASLAMVGVVSLVFGPEYGVWAAVVSMTFSTAANVLTLMWRKKP